ncbi:hypothetical protein GCM10023169_22410 [Georgenia halophila]|uniref:Uncharacterized protein n=1 Tax=Georgenia halophila TaxID=620889 RepID=A0ABP8LA74_9MICO
MQNRVLTASIGSVVSGAFTLYPIWRAPSWVKVTYIVLPAAAAGVAMTFVRRGGDASPSGRTSAYAAAAVAVIGTASWASIKLDKGVESLVSRTGARRPRVVMAIGAAALSAALDYADARRQSLKGRCR